MDEQRDFVSKFKYFNTTALQAQMQNNSLVLGSSPRWIMRGSIAPAVKASKASAGGNTERHKLESLVTNILICDLEQEQKLGIGRGFPHRLLGYGEAHVTDSVLSTLGVRAEAGQRVKVDLGLGKLLATFDITPQFLEQTFLASIMEDGVPLRLNGTLITQEFRARGFDVPPNVLPAEIDMKIPVDEVVDMRKLIAATVDGIVNGGLMDLELTVVSAIRGTYEKWPPIGNVVLIEARHFLAELKEVANRVRLMQILNLAASVDENKDEELETTIMRQDTPVADMIFGRDLFSYSFMLLVQYRHRLRAYTSGTRGALDEMVAFSDSVGRDIGFDSPLQMTLPVARALEPLKFLRIFLQQLFNAVVFVLVVHGCITIYALLLNDASARTYEYGMLRVLGLRKYSLGFLLVAQGLYMALPGVALGLLASAALSVPILAQIAEFALVPPDYTYQPAAIFTAIGVGLLIPLIGNMVPMRRVLTRTLGESLDVYHQASTETTVNVKRLEDMGLSVTQTLVALLLVGSGGVIYYIIPMSFIFQDLDLLLSALNAILLGTVFGLISLSVILQPILERCYVHGIMWGADRNLVDIVLKNLSSHRERGRKTSLMFTSSLAFLIFAGTMFSLQADSIIGNIKSALGSDLRVESSRGGLDEAPLAQYLDWQKSRPSKQRIVQDYTWVSWPLWNVDPPVYTTRLGNSVNFPQSWAAEVTAIQPNYLDVAYGEYFVPRESDGCEGRSRGGTQCVRELEKPYDDALKRKTDFHINPLSFTSFDVCDYDTDPYCDNVHKKADSALQFEALVPASLGPALGAEIGTEIVSVIQAQNSRNNPSSRRYLYLQMIPKVLVSKFPGFFFSSYSASLEVGTVNVLIGESTWQALLDLCVRKVRLNATRIGLPTTPPKRYLHVRYVDGTDKDGRLEIINGIKSFVGEDVRITDTLHYVELTAGTLDLLMAFFYVVASIASLLCFFMIFTTFEANVRDNLWEFGVLRALGLTAQQLIRVFFYEAMAMILASITLGTAIGVTIAAVLTLQQNLFTEMPFRLVFPGGLFAIVISMSLGVAGLGAYLPVREMLRCSISQVLKGI